MKIIVTGCAGMIGCYLTSELLNLYPRKKGNEVIGIDNLSRGKLSNLKEACSENFMDLIFVKEDLTIFHENWTKYFIDSDVVVHLADIVAGIGYVFANESHVFRTNLLINSNLTKAIFQTKPDRYIYVGTACSFPRKLQLSVSSEPLVEEDQFPAEPESGYGWSKLMGEIESNYLAKEGITNSVILSLHNVYGRYCDLSPSTSQVIPSLCDKAISSLSNKKIINVWGDGNQGRAFVHAKDVVDSIKKALVKGENKGVIQIGPKKCTTINEIAKIIINNLDSELKIEHDLSKPVGDVGRRANASKAKRLLGWEPNIPIDEGIKDLLDWIIKFKGAM
tara:strand:+ start:637 stop:1641 length:1005 start_codon:yes stop_codon:yes gene_type:complete